jgi:hypothetical protein
MISKKLYILLLAAILITLPSMAFALSSTPSEQPNASTEIDKNKATPNYKNPMNIVSFLIGPNMGSLCGYLKIPEKLENLCSKILTCVVDIAMDKFDLNTKKRSSTPGARSDCGLMQCYSAAVSKTKINTSGLSDSQKTTARTKIANTISQCAAVCNNLAANTKAQKICGLGECYDDAMKLLADANYEFPEYCCSVVSGKWGGELGKAIDTFCKGSSTDTDLKCMEQWNSDKKLTGECCAAIDEIKTTLSEPELAETYCKSATVIESCSTHWKKEVQNCEYWRQRGSSCTERPDASCCVLVNERAGNQYINTILNNIGVTGSPSSYSDSCPSVPDAASTINEACSLDPSFCFEATQ